MLSKDLIRKIQKRKRDLHSKFLKDLSTTLLPRLFENLGVRNYTIRQKLIEPRSHPAREEISPDLIIVYDNSKLNVLLIEAKLSKCPDFIEETLLYFKSFAYGNRGVESLYEILGQKISLEELQTCGIRSVAVHRTKKGGFRIYRAEELK